jgi:hypothetical protein
MGIEPEKLALLLSLKEEGKGLLILNLRSSLPIFIAILAGVVFFLPHPNPPLSKGGRE